MEFSKFVEKISGITQVSCNDNSPYWATTEEGRIPPRLENKWITGGCEGGNCWGSSAEPFTGDAKPDFKALDEVLNKLAPNLKFSDYKVLKELIKEDDYTDSGYYGNYTNYGVEYIDLKELFNFLKSLGEL